jgi:dephospho-CoA kinase
MIVIGLTGSIGMGKSTAAAHFAGEGIAASDSDAIVHALYAAGGAAVEPVAKAFPGAEDRGGIDRRRLAIRLTDDPRGFERLQAIVHPLVRAAQEEFIARQRVERAAAAVLDIPLLFETGRDRDMDLTIVVTAPEEVQRARVLARPGMTVEKLETILARQMPDAEKRRRADAVIDMSKDLSHAEGDVRWIAAAIRGGRIHARNRS